MTASCMAMYGYGGAIQHDWQAAMVDWSCKGLEVGPMTQKLTLVKLGMTTRVCLKSMTSPGAHLIYSFTMAHDN